MMGINCRVRGQAVHTPGHTPGHTSYFQRAQRILIAGDALGYWGGELRFPMPIYCENRLLAMDSIGKLAVLEPEIICFGHRGVLYGAATRLREFAWSLEMPGSERDPKRA
jgi:glyoxylase-like metal-dependent hydrolase (beta-lactamase superfamily II)